MPSEIRQVIENSHLFSGLDPGLIDDIAASATKRTLGIHELLFQKGDRADALWGVLSGRIVIEVRADDGKELVLDEFHAGDVFGEVGVLDFGPRRVEATAGCRSELFRLERSHFLEHLQTNPELCFRVFSLLCGHLRNTTETLEDTALYRLPNRLAKRLTLMSNEVTRDGGQAVLKVVQSDLARMMGVNREAVNRQLRAWEKSGWISIQRQCIKILEDKALADLAAPSQVLEHQGWGNDDLTRAAYAACSGQVVNPANRERETVSELPERRFAGILAVTCAEYAGMLMTDSANTVKRIKAGLAAIDKAIADHGGRVIWSAGERTLAEFQDGESAVGAALEIQKNADEAGDESPERTNPIFRIGIHSGEILASEGKTIGEPVNVAIRLTELSGSGGISLTSEVRDELEETGNLELRYLGKHELKNMTEPIGVFSAHPIPWLNRIALWAASMMPGRFRPVIAIAAVLFAVTVTWLAGERFGVSRMATTPTQSIAVMPFMLEGNPENTYLANGMAEEIRTALAGLPETLVIGRQSSQYFKQWNATGQEIGEILQVSYILQGTVSLKDDQLSLSSRLVETGNGTEIWHRNYQGTLQQFNEFQADIIQRTNETLTADSAGGLSAFITTPAIDNNEAYDLYLQARALIHEKTKASLLEALAKLEKAVELEPGFASAHVAMADTYMQLSYYTGYYEELQEKWWQLATPHVEKALAIAPNLAEAHVMLGIVSEDEGSDPTSAFRKAISLNPNHARAHLWLGIALANDSQVSSWSAQMPYIEKALEIEPLSIEAATNMVSFLTWFPQRREEAWAIIDSLNQHYPDHPDVKWTEASLLLNESRPSDAVPLLEEIIANDPNNGTAGILLSMAWFALGETERAMRASTWGPQYRLVLSPNPEEALGQMKISSADMGPAIAAYIFVMLRHWQSAIDVLAEHSDDIVAFEKKYAAVVAKRYSPAMSLAFAYKSLGDIERSSVFVEFEKEALNIKSENGKIRNSEYLTVKARLNALDGKHYEAIQELERLITLGPVDLRILMHPAFDEIRELPQFIQLQELQRGLVNAEREKLGLLPLPAGVSHQLVQKTAE